MTGVQLCRRRLSAALALAMFAAAPFVVFHATVQDAATHFRMEPKYLVSGWGPWVLVALGTLCFVPVIVSLGRGAYSRLFITPAAKRAYEIWGSILYILGLMLLTQTAQISSAF